MKMPWLKSKIFASVKEFMPEREKLRNYFRKLVFTNGCFDIIHRGHCEYLFAARCLGDYLVIGLNTDDSVSRLKGDGRPIQSLDDRAFVLASLYFVDAVIPFSEDTPLELIMAVKPDILVKGAEYELDDIVGAQEVELWGGIVKRIPMVKGFSTSELIQKIKSMPLGK